MSNPCMHACIRLKSRAFDPNDCHRLLTGGQDSGSSQGSLFHLVDRTSTGFGSRLLRHWISHPLTQIHMIQRRQEAVAELVDATSGERP